MEVPEEGQGRWRRHALREPVVVAPLGVQPRQHHHCRQQQPCFHAHHAVTSAAYQKVVTVARSRFRFLCLMTLFSCDCGGCFGKGNDSIVMVMIIWLFVFVWPRSWTNFSPQLSPNRDSLQLSDTRVSWRILCYAKGAPTRPNTVRRTNSVTISYCVAGWRHKRGVEENWFGNTLLTLRRTVFGRMDASLGWDHTYAVKRYVSLRIECWRFNTECNELPWTAMHMAVLLRRDTFEIRVYTDIIWSS